MSPRLQAMLTLAVPILVIVGGIIALRFVARVDGERFKEQAHTVVKTLLGMPREHAVNDPHFKPAMRFLQADLVYPLMIALSMTIAAIAAAYRLDERVSIWWVVLPVLVGLLADWAENGIQLREMMHLRDNVPVETHRFGVMHVAEKLKFAPVITLAWLCYAASRLWKLPD